MIGQGSTHTVSSQVVPQDWMFRGRSTRAPSPKFHHHLERLLGNLLRARVFETVAFPQQKIVGTGPISGSPLKLDVRSQLKYLVICVIAMLSTF